MVTVETVQERVPRDNGNPISVSLNRSVSFEGSKTEIHSNDRRRVTSNK